MRREMWGCLSARISGVKRALRRCKVGRVETQLCCDARPGFQPAAQASNLQPQVHVINRYIRYIFCHFFPNLRHCHVTSTYVCNPYHGFVLFESPRNFVAPVIYTLRYTIQKNNRLPQKASEGTFHSFPRKFREREREREGNAGLCCWLFDLFEPSLPSEVLWSQAQLVWCLGDVGNF